MTKLVRIENADTSNYRVQVQVFDKGRDGEPDTLVLEETLLYPAAMTAQHIHNSRYIVIKEAP